MRERRSIWFTIGWICLTLAWAPPLLSFLAVLTCGLVYLPLVVCVFGSPYCLLHYLLWGHRFNR